MTRNQFVTHRGSSAGANPPFGGVQIYYAQLDCFVVDDTSRLPPCRPWVTTAFDMYTLMALGFRIALAPPGSGAKIAHR